MGRRHRVGVEPARRSSGTTPRWASASSDQVPVRLARSTAASPRGVIRPSAVRRATSSRLIVLQALLALRGVKRRHHEPASCLRAWLSIHPAQRASSIASRCVTLGAALRAWGRTSHTSAAVSPWAASQARHASRSTARRVGIAPAPPAVAASPSPGAAAGAGVVAGVPAVGRVAVAPVRGMRWLLVSGGPLGPRVVCPACCAGEVLIP